MHYTRELVRFGLDTYRAARLPDAVERMVEDIIVDQVGLQLACSQYVWSDAVYRYVRQFAAPGRSTVLYHGDLMSPEQAAFVNGSFGHSQDYDDTTPMVQTHVGAVIVPVALAIGEEVGATGRDVLNAAAAGMEILLRIAHSVSPDCLRKGHHTPPAAGPFAAAMTAGLMLGLDEDQLVAAMGIAGSFSGSLLEYTQAGGSVKRIHCAIPTTGGIRAAYLARLGMTGPETVLEGSKGFCSVFADEPKLDRLTDGLGERYLVSRVGFKFYNCCLFIHAPMEALMDIVSEHHLRPSDIERVDVGTSRQGVVHVGQIPDPVDELGAQFSLHFSLAVALLREMPRLRTYDADCLHDREIRRFSQRVVVHEDEVATAEYPANWGGVVSVATRDGRLLTRRARFPKGNPENPMTPEDMRAKFFGNAGPELGPEACAAAHEAVRAIAEQQDLGAITRHLVVRRQPELQLAGRGAAVAD